MATISWNEIRKRAVSFAHAWKEVERETSEAQTFWNEFFAIFGVQRRDVALFEASVAKLATAHTGRIDLFWPGKLIAEHKSKGKDLDAAFLQAVDYGLALKDTERPRFIIVSDFARIRLYELDFDDHVEFTLEDLPKQIDRFGFIAGYRTQPLKPEDPVNIAAAEKMGKLHDALKASGYDGHPLEVLLVRLLFLLFAEDTRVFEDIRGFEEWVKQRTVKDGSDLGSKLAEAFQILNTPVEKRSALLDEMLARFPYVNGLLFAEALPIAAFDAHMRDLLLNACEMDWSTISPSIFGSMFQSIMDKEKRRNLGAHYTSEENILKVIRSLFLDDLWVEFHKVKKSSDRLKKFHEKLRGLTFLDPACGCGNFLVVAYRELRLLELEILRQLKTGKQWVLDVDELIKLNVDQFFGIEIEEFPARVAEVALWLTDHQMNMKVGQEFGSYFVRIPLRTSPSILNTNALRVDWRKCFGHETVFDYIFGNPPFAGHRYRSEDQTTDLRYLWGKESYNKLLDYVTGWYYVAQRDWRNTPTRFGFVSTNSISQGEQVAHLWAPLYEAGFHIDYCHTPFIWTSEASGAAAVHVVIVGFSHGGKPGKKTLYHQTRSTDELKTETADMICPYLVPGPELVVTKHQTPISKVLPRARYGSLPSDGGGLVVLPKDYPSSDPIAQKYLHRFVGSSELVNETDRWCLWMPEGPESGDIRKSDFIRERLERVREWRRRSVNPDTQELADQPYRFFFVSKSTDPFVAFPAQVTNARRWYTPSYLTSDVIPSNTLYWALDPEGLVFAVTSSSMFMAWLRTVGGKIKSDPRFGEAVYNSFPLPDLGPAERKGIALAGRKLAEERKAAGAASLAVLYEANAVPRAVVKAHEALDAVVDKSFGFRGKDTVENRFLTLIARYSEVVAKQ
jgi:hypothetical protein